jgi:hypothetical protein
MKYFKCGHCKKSYKIDESKVTHSKITIKCVDCGASNVLRFGAILIAQTKTGVKQFELKMGINTLGRKYEKAESVIQLDDQFVSRKHAEITLEERDQKLYAFITDKESLNGTFNKMKSRLKTNLKYPITANDYYIVGLTKLSIKYN